MKFIITVLWKTSSRTMKSRRCIISQKINWSTFSTSANAPTLIVLDATHELQYWSASVHCSVSSKTTEIECWLCEGAGCFLEVDPVNEDNTKEQTCGMCDGYGKIEIISNAKD
tara:strand:+ start:992 stop:1330 length:339 start_codon:yes stop_codon:yes gene_type:complete